MTSFTSPIFAPAGVNSEFVTLSPCAVPPVLAFGRSPGLVGPPRLDLGVVAIDTEFQGPHTLTVQAATLLADGRVAVQIYRSPLVPDPPPDFAPATYFPAGRSATVARPTIVFRQVKLLTPDLSPLQIHRDLHDRRDLVGVPLATGLRVAADNQHCRPRYEAELTVVAHFLRADFGRIFGANFLAELWSNSGVSIRDSKVIEFAQAGRHGNRPVVQYFQDGVVQRGLRLRFFDTALPFGPASLEAHSRTFLGVGKVAAFCDAEKAEMARMFRERTADAYGYAMIDALNTLLVFGRMRIGTSSYITSSESATLLLRSSAVRSAGG
jgi:hypothetical protein